MPARPAGAPRSLADDLRARDDAQLLALLRGRPDLTAPVPADITSLAARAATRASVGRALDALDAFTLRAVDVLAVLPEPASRTEVARLLGVRPGAARPPGAGQPRGGGPCGGRPPGGGRRAGGPAAGAGAAVGPGRRAAARADR